MSYNYERVKHNIFTEEGQVEFLRMRDKVAELLDFYGFSGDSWEIMAYIDRLSELNKIEEITAERTRGQNRVFVRVEKE